MNRLMSIVPEAVKCINDLDLIDYEMLESGKYYYVNNTRNNKWYIVKIIGEITEDNLRAKPIKVLNDAKDNWIAPLSLNIEIDPDTNTFLVEDFYVKGKLYLFYVHRHLSGGQKIKMRRSTRKTAKKA